ncbi:MAG: hypothetical protein CBE49_003580 [Rickettsiales bacterium TMED289]|nr:MAG: hypothetical protein CBE49_003580 [Rickettsiales bacterium TMED289]|tara:strand:- start:2396 stop:3232 length:837 start_codon:yes stop_codon:yes gene_type:complete
MINFKNLKYIFAMVKAEPLHHIKKLFSYLKNIPISLNKNIKIDYVIAIYTLGKSGSSSILSTLQEKFSSPNVIQLHFINCDYIRQNHPNDFASRNIDKANLFLKNHSKKKIKYISLVREPISREISSFYQNRPLYFKNISPNDYKAINNLIEEKAYDLALNWFDYELKKHLNFDVYSQKFDKTKGFSIYKIDSDTELMVLRTDFINKTGLLALNKFLNSDIKQIKSVNVGSSKSNSFYQNQMKSYFKISDLNLEKIKNSKFMNHFFTKEEIKNLYLNK